MLRSGVAQVRLQVLRLPPPLRYTLQIGSFRVPDNAHSLLHRLQGRDIPATLEPFGQLIRVVTEAATEAELPTIEQRLRAAGSLHGCAGCARSRRRTGPRHTLAGRAPAVYNLLWRHVGSPNRRGSLSRDARVPQ